MNKLLKMLLMGLNLRSFIVEEGGGNGEETVGTGNDARIAMLERINDQNDALRADEFVEIDDAGQVDQFIPNPVEQTLPPSDADDHTADVELQRMAEETAQEEEKFKIKINGRELELTREQLIERAQKVEAADTYLAEAARLRKEAVEQTRQPKQPVPSAEDQAQAAEEERRALVRAIQMGTEEEAMAAIAKLQRPVLPAFNADDVSKTIDERLSFKEAVSRFEKDYSDILADSMLKNIAIQQDQQLLAQGDTRGYYERFAAIGEGLRNWRNSVAKSAAPVQVNPDKQAKKAAAPATPKAASVKTQAPVADEDQDEAPSAVIAAMAKSRGGPQWMRS